MLDFAAARRTMVDCQVRTFDVTDLAVIAAFDSAPREKFVPASRQALAYSDVAVPLDGQGAGRSLLPPMFVARLLQELDLRPGESVLDAGCATGYTTFLLAHLGVRVIGLESDEAMAEAARRELSESGYPQVEIVTGAIAEGYAKGAPYDAILVNGAFEVIPQKLIDQLVDGGRLIGIEAMGSAPKATLYKRSGTALSRQPLFNCAAPVIEGLKRSPGFAF